MEAAAAERGAAAADGPDWLAAVGRPNRRIVRGRYQRLTDFRASATDPDAGLMPGSFGSAHMGYHTHYVVDGGKARIILGVLVTPTRPALIDGASG